MKNGDFPLLWRINRGFFASARAEAYLRLPHSLLSGVGLLGAVAPAAGHCSSTCNIASTKNAQFSYKKTELRQDVLAPWNHVKLQYLFPCVEGAVQWFVVHGIMQLCVQLCVQFCAHVLAAERQRDGFAGDLWERHNVSFSEVSCKDNGHPRDLRDWDSLRLSCNLREKDRTY